MSALFRPVWLLASVTLPQALLIVACAAAWRVVAPLLTQRGERSWAVAGGILALLLAGFTVVALRAMIARRPLPRRLGPALLAAYLPLLAAVVLGVVTLAPPGIERWMLPHGDLRATALALVMPALIHGLFLTVAWLTPDDRSASAWRSFAGAVAVPLAWYLAFTAGIDAWRGRAAATALPALGILGAVAFLFLVVRAAQIAVAKNEERLRRLRPLWVALVAVVFPQLGLALHGGLLLGGSLPRAPFGDFGHPAFFVLAAANGILLCLRPPAGARARWGLACGRAALLPFTLYFFVVFLPWFPLSVVAVVACGLGLLMLTPLALLRVHAEALQKDGAHLRAGAGTARTASVLIAAMLVLPVALVGVFLHDRAVLRGALAHVHAPDYADQGRPAVDPAVLGRVLAHVRAHREGGRPGLLDERVPYLSPLYQRLVLGRPTLSETAVRELEAVFLGTGAAAAPGGANGADGAARDAVGPREVVLSGISSTPASIVDAQTQRSEVRLAITNSGSRAGEYATSFALPEHAWVAGLQLRIGDRDEPGILADARAAAWVYRRIVSTRRDPAIIHRQPDGRYGLRVFPVAAGETRSVGIEILHRESFALRIDGEELLLGEGSQPAAAPSVVRVGGGEVHFVPAAVKRGLPITVRTPVFHFIVDCSAAAAPLREEFVRRIGGFFGGHRLDAASVRFTLADAGQTSFDGFDGWERRVREHEGTGGFFLGRSVKSILRRAHEERGETYPVLIVVTDALERALVPDGLAGFAFAAPEGDVLHRLEPDTGLTTYRFADLSVPTSAGAMPWGPVPVLAYPSRERPLAYLRDDGSGSVVIAGEDLFAEDEAVGGSGWESGLALEGTWRALQLDPVDRRRKELLLIRRSFAAGVMSRATAFIALEDEAQKRALLAKQERTLAPRAVLDADEDAFEQMSEPGWLVLGVLLLLAAAVHARQGTAGRMRGLTG